jgi:hypothetical protein
MTTYLHKAQKSPNRLNPKRHSPRHIIIKLSKVKGKEKFKTSRKKATTHNKIISIRLSVDFSAETLQIRRE